MERATEVHGVPCRVVELTGEPGEAVFCNLGVLHAVAPNCSEQPRNMRVKFLFLDQMFGCSRLGPSSSCEPTVLGSRYRRLTERLDKRAARA